MTKLLLSISLISAIAASPVLAQSAETMTRNVQVANLHLGTADGVARLDRRIRQAVDAVCGRPQDDRALAEAIAACRSAAFAEAQPQRELALDGTAGNRPIRIARIR